MFTKDRYIVYDEGGLKVFESTSRGEAITFADLKEGKHYVVCGGYMIYANWWRLF